MKLLKFFFLAIMIFSAGAANAQRKPVVKPQAKYKPPRLITSLAGYSDSAVTAKPEAIRIISLPLTVKDAKGTVYTISSYNFLYKQIVFTEDDKAEKVSLTTAIKTDLFKTTPLPKSWIATATEDLKSGEEYFFFDIIAKDSQGRVMYSPDLKIKIR